MVDAWHTDKFFEWNWHVFILIKDTDHLVSIFCLQPRVKVQIAPESWMVGWLMSIVTKKSYYILFLSDKTSILKTEKALFYITCILSIQAFLFGFN